MCVNGRAAVDARRPVTKGRRAAYPEEQRGMLLPHKKCIQHDLLVLCALRPWPPPVCAGAVVNAAFGSIAEAAATHRRPASH